MKLLTAAALSAMLLAPAGAMAEKLTDRLAKEGVATQVRGR